MPFLRCAAWIIPAILVLGCDAGRTTPSAIPESPVLASPTAPVPRSGPRAREAFVVEGVISDESGTPVSGAKVSFLDGLTDPSVATDQSGFYRIEFTSFPGADHNERLDPPGTENTVGFLQVEASGYERFAQFLLAPSSGRIVEHLRVQRIRRVTAGASTMITIGPADTVCVIDVWPGRNLTCGIVRLDVPSDGVATVTAVPADQSAPRPQIELYGGLKGTWGNPATLQVRAGTEYFINVQVPWGQERQSFLVTTSLQRP